MNVLRKISAIALLCALCVCLLAGCGSDTPDTDATTTTVGDTTTADGVTTTTGSNAPSASGSASATKKPSNGGTNTSASNDTGVPDPIASVSGIQIGGTALSGFSGRTDYYIHYLPTGTTAVPKVTATKTGGTGEISVTQATSVNGTAKVMLNDEVYTIQFVVKRAESEILDNTYYQLKKNNKLNVAYLGGSVTDGHSSDSSYTAGTDSWRAQTTNWFKTQYPSAKITETNAGIGGTGSMYGAYRVIDDLKLRSASEKPDLVFIEFAANDKYDAYVNKTPDVYMESIIRTIYQYAPQADIVMVLITDSGAKDTEYDAKAAHKKIADVYQIPYIDVGARLWKEMAQESGSASPSASVFNKYFGDTVHPAKAGYAKYAQYIKEYLNGVLSQKSAVPASLKKAPTPSAAVTKLPVAPHVANFKGMTLGTGMTVSPDGYLVTKQGGKFTFKFTGTDLYAWIYGQSANVEEAGYIRVCIDGGKVEIDGKKRQKIAVTGTNHKLLPIVTGLSNGEHTVELEIIPESSGKVNLDLRYFLISGDTQLRGITLA